MDISKPALFHILLALAERDRHGYAVMQEVRGRSEGRVRLNSASFYRHLDRLITAGLVEESTRRPADDDPRRGAYYRATRAGQAALAAERRRLGDLIAAVDALRPARRRQG